MFYSAYHRLNKIFPDSDPNIRNGLSPVLLHRPYSAPSRSNVSLSEQFWTGSVGPNSRSTLLNPIMCKPASTCDGTLQESCPSDALSIIALSPLHFSLDVLHAQRGWDREEERIRYRATSTGAKAGARTRKRCRKSKPVITSTTLAAARVNCEFADPQPPVPGAYGFMVDDHHSSAAVAS